MRRFVEQAFSERSLEADAAELMRAAGPTPDAPAVKQRVRERLVQAPARRRPHFVLALASALAALALGTAAAATVGARWWRAAHDTTGPAARPAPPPLPAPRLAPVDHRVDFPAPVPAEEARLPAEVPAAARPAPAPPPAIARAASHARPARPVGPYADAETGLLFESTRALRRDRDPVRAGALLDEYFRRYPHGTVSEEALAVAIEAAVARNDPRAPTFARRYLARYPNGQFRNAAERALGGLSK